MDNVPGGPYIAVARFCDNILFEQDGIPTLIRLLETVVVSVTAPHGVDQDTLDRLENPWPVPLTFFLSAFGFPTSQETEIRVRIWRPDGTEVDPPIDIAVLPGGQHNGININFQLSLAIRQSGVYFFDITHKEQFLTRVPLRLVVELHLAETATDSASESAIFATSDPNWLIGKSRQMTIVVPESPQAESQESTPRTD